jgi:hypothetical protein
MAQSGPIYDNASKAMFAHVVEAMCRWLDTRVAGDVSVVRISEVMPAAARQVDALVAVGSDLLVHIEFQTSAETGFWVRMLDYRLRLYLRPEARGKRLVQHVVMLSDGTIDDGMQDEDLTYRYRVHYLRHVPVKEFLAEPELAPWAVLADVSDSERPAILARAAALISTVEDEELRAVLASVAADLALLRLDIDIITATWEVYAMPIPSFAEALAQQRAEESYKDGLEKGRDLEREQMLTGMLRHRFGADPAIPALVRRLAALDLDVFLSRYERANSLDELASTD